MPLPSAIHLAQTDGDAYESAGRLIEKGASINHVSTPRARTSLMIAADRGFHRTASLLIECGANVNQSTSLGYVALMYAVLRSDFAMADMLLRAGAEVSELVMHVTAAPLKLEPACRRLLEQMAQRRKEQLRCITSEASTATPTGLSVHTGFDVSPPLYRSWDRLIPPAC